MSGLLAPKHVLHVLCDESVAAGEEVLAEGEKLPWNSYSAGGVEMIYEAKNDAGEACVYNFAPWHPRKGSGKNAWPSGSQFIYRSSEPGTQVTFRTKSDWSSLSIKAGPHDGKRYHYEVKDVALDFPEAGQPMGALHLEAFADPASGGLMTAVLRRVSIRGGKNALFLPGGATMLYIEDSDIGGNIGGHVDQQHSTYINGIISTHMVNTKWWGQRASGAYGGHQLKDKAYLRIYEDVSVTNVPDQGDPSTMPLNDITAFGFTWSKGLKLDRVKPNSSERRTRDALVDIRTSLLYTPAEQIPYAPGLNDSDWTMPMARGEAIPDGLAQNVYLHVFHDTEVNSYREEPYVFRLHLQGTEYNDDDRISGPKEDRVPEQQRMVGLAFGTTGTFESAWKDQGHVYADPAMPADAEFVFDKDAFAYHSLNLLDAKLEGALSLPWK